MGEFRSGWCTRRYIDRCGSWNEWNHSETQQSNVNIGLVICTASCLELHIENIFYSFEKMISAMYICELVRVSLIKCAEKHFLFQGEIPDKLKVRDVLKPTHIYTIEQWVYSSIVFCMNHVHKFVQRQYLCHKMQFYLFLWRNVITYFLHKVGQNGILMFSVGCLA